MICKTTRKALCADALAGAAGKQVADISQGATYNRARCEHEQCGYQQCTAAQDIRKNLR
jgi:hypothetical protein